LGKVRNFAVEERRLKKGPYKSQKTAVKFYGKGGAG